MPLAVAVYLVHKQPLPVASVELAIPHRDVTLRTSDGVKLAGWYVPPRNGAVVVLVHGAGGDRTGGIESRATMLARHGYGVLLYDARGDGSSTGRPESFGWTWHRDAEAAVEFLARRGIITRIGALGLSTGAEVVLETAGRDRRIRAVVAEGAQARSWSELRLLPVTPSDVLAFAYSSEQIAPYRVLAHASPPPSLATEVARIAPRPIFLISSGRDYERDLNRAYAAHAGGPATVWEMPDAPHTGGLATYPREYDERVTRFLDRALLGTTA
jgi:pimeloyl-ACP methyl ester carboxylesterase